MLAHIKTDEQFFLVCVQCVVMDHRDGGFLRNLSLLQYGTPLIVNSCGICSSPQLRKRLGSSSSFVKRFQTEHRLRGHRGCVNCINFSFEGDQLVSGSDDLKIILWDWKKGRSIMSFPSQHVANIFQVRLYMLSVSVCAYVCVCVRVWLCACVCVCTCNIKLANKSVYLLSM